MSVEVEKAVSRDGPDAPFSYVCNRCLHCCRDKLIQVNPYEAARLARNRGLTTTDFITRHLDGVYLLRSADGACEFLGPEGCTVHSDRPLVCRLYPLGRHVGTSGEITYSHHAPHPETKGIYGQHGTITDFLVNQGVAPFTAAADRYLEALQTLFDAWRRTTEIAEPSPASIEADSFDATLLFDLDRAVATHCRLGGIDEPTDIEDRMTLHLGLIRRMSDSESR